MKNIQLLVALVLVALATATQVETTTYGAGYAWWLNLALFGVRAGIYNTCLFSTWALAFFANDAGVGFGYCLQILGQFEFLSFGSPSQIMALEYEA